MTFIFRHAPWALALLLTVSGCASVPAERATAEVDALLSARGTPTADAVGDDDPTGAPMTRERAWQFALRHSPRLQAEYARIGLARADVIEATRLSNPTLSFARMRPDEGEQLQWTRGVALPLAELLMLPARSRLAKQDYERAKFEIAAALLDLRGDIDRAWYTCVGAEQVARMRAAVADAGAVSAELAQRFFDAGNISELQLRQEQAAASEARIAAARARAEALSARLQLNLAIGLSGPGAAWQVAEQLPMPLDAEDEVEDLVALARQQRLDLLAARQQVTVLEDAARTGRRWRLLGGAEVGYEQETDTDGQRLQGPNLALEVPIFHQGQARVARNEAQLQIGRASLAQRELEAENAVRLAAERVRVLADVVRLHREALVPQREAIVARSQERQNYMLIGVFELLQAKAHEFDAYQSYLEALRDYWLARVELTHAVGTRLPSEDRVASPTTGADQILSPPAPAMDHSGHDMSGMEGMDHSGHDMSGMEGMDHSGHDMSGMEGMDHSGHDMQDLDHGNGDGGAPSAPKTDEEPSPKAPAEREPTHEHHHGGQP